MKADPNRVIGCPAHLRTYPDGCGHSITTRMPDGTTVCSWCVQTLPPTTQAPRV